MAIINLGFMCDKCHKKWSSGNQYFKHDCVPIDSQWDAETIALSEMADEDSKSIGEFFDSIGFDGK